MLREQCSRAHPCAAELLLMLAALSLPSRANGQELMACRHLFAQCLNCFSCDTGASFLNIALCILHTAISYRAAHKRSLLAGQIARRNSYAIAAG